MHSANADMACTDMGTVLLAEASNALYTLTILCINKCMKCSLEIKQNVFTHLMYASNSRPHGGARLTLATLAVKIIVYENESYFFLFTSYFSQVTMDDILTYSQV